MLVYWVVCYYVYYKLCSWYESISIGVIMDTGTIVAIPFVIMIFLALILGLYVAYPSKIERKMYKINRELESQKKLEKILGKYESTNNIEEIN